MGWVRVTVKMATMRLARAMPPGLPNTPTTPSAVPFDAPHNADTNVDSAVAADTNQSIAGEAFPGLPNQIVISLIFRSDNLAAIDLEQLRVVSRRLCVAVDATGRHIEQLNSHQAVACGCVGTLIHLKSRGRLTHTRLLCKYAARGGQLETLKWAHANGCAWNGMTCMYAARGGYLEVLQWARANGCPWNKAMCAAAAINGHLELLQWAHANGCPWPVGTCAAAVEGRHLEILKWAHANGCPWDAETCAEAAYVRMRMCEDAAISGDRLEVAKWVMQNRDT